MRRVATWGIPLLIIVILAGCFLAYRALSNQVNISGFVGSGGEARIEVPEGFMVEVFAKDLIGPRFLTFGPDGHLYVAERGADRILRLEDIDQDGTADVQQIFAGNLDAPHSLVFHDGSLYVGLPSGVVRLNDSDGDGLAEGCQILIDDYPTNGHSTRTIAFLPDNRMVVSVGSSCNVCVEDDERRAAIVVYDGPDAEGERVFARGLRNAVGLAIHPLSGQLWATNNGRDLLGDDLPPDAVYQVFEGGNYGWPFCNSGGKLEDPDFGFEGSCEGIEPSVADLQAHSAPLGLVFYDGATFPEEYKGDLFVAYHGSWNRSIPTGYKVVRIPMNGSSAAGPVDDFAVGWLNEASGDVAGRPTGLAVGPDGALYVSDDKAGLIYRISFLEP